MSRPEVIVVDSASRPPVRSLVQGYAGRLRPRYLREDVQGCLAPATAASPRRVGRSSRSSTTTRRRAAIGPGDRRPFEADARSAVSAARALPFSAAPRGHAGCPIDCFSSRASPASETTGASPAPAPSGRSGPTSLSARRRWRGRRPVLREPRPQRYDAPVRGGIRPHRGTLGVGLEGLARAAGGSRAHRSRRTLSLALLLAAPLVGRRFASARKTATKLGPGA